MKIYISLKDPDALEEAIRESLENFTVEGLQESEIEIIRDKRAEECREKASEWFEYGEYFTICFDSEENTCEVIPHNN